MLRRSRADWPVVLAAFVLLASALGLLAAGTLYSDAVTLAGLRRALEAAPPADRAVVVQTRILPERLDTADAVAGPELERVIAPTGGSVTRILRSSPYADAAADPDTVTDLVRFASYDGIEAHAALVDGRWPTPGSSPVEATLSEPAARALGVSAGDTLRLVSRLDARRAVDVLVTGTWRADPADPWWLGEPLALTGSAGSGQFTDRGPLVVASDDVRTGALSETLDAEWRAIPDVGGFTPDVLEAVSTAAMDARGRINAALPPSNQARVSTELPSILASVDRSVLVAQAGILLLLVQFGVLAGYAVVLVAALLLERRRTETALLQTRGAGHGHLLALTAGEAVLVTIPAVLVAPWLAMLLVGVVAGSPALAAIGLEAPPPSAETFAVAAFGGLFALVALVVPTLAGSITIAGVRASVGRQVGRTLPQRLGLDLALVGLAALALFQLRLYGAPITRNARGALGTDPLLVAAPAIGLIGGAVLATRIVPRLAELGERVLARRPGLVPSLGARQLARRPLRYTRVALLLILAAALGTFASAHAATWSRSQVDQAAYAAGADVRVVNGQGSGVPGWAQGGTLRALPGVTAATPVVRASIDLGTTLRDGPLTAIDGDALAGIVRLRDDEAGARTLDALRELGTHRPDVPGIAVPAGTRRLSVVASSELLPVEGFAGMPDGFEGLVASVHAVDGDGRLVRIDGPAAATNASDVRLEVPLTGAGGEAPVEPLHVLSLLVTINSAPVGQSLVQGWVDVGALEASPDAVGDAWAPLSGATGPWTVAEGGTRRAYAPPTTDPTRLLVEGLFNGSRLVYQQSLAAPSAADRPELPALVGPAFLERASASVGDTLGATVFGVPVDLRVVRAIDSFPTVDGESPFVLVDGLSLDLARHAAGATIAEADEWWIAAQRGTTGAIAAAASAEPFRAERVVDGSAVLAGLVGNPLGLGVIGILSLGSVAALAFAAIGFLVSTTVSTAERLGEFALLKALGLAPRQLTGWLSFESIVLLVVGIVAGVALGLVLAWLALPFATLTASGEAPVPAPVVVVPADALVPPLVLAVLLVLATLVIARRQLPSARTSAVLRARDE